MNSNNRKGLHNIKQTIKGNEGASLIFVLIIITIMLFMSRGTIDVIVRQINNQDNLFRSEQAWYAARSSMEFATADASHHGVGYENSDDVEIGDTTGDGIVDVTGSYEVIARAKTINWTADSSSACGFGSNCYIPIPGTGTAGGESCDFTDPEQDWADTGDGWDDECNWNTIAYGETVSIPFFYTESDGTVMNPDDMGLTSFTLRVRAPKDENSIRYTLDTTSDDVVVSWEFNGTCDSDGDGVDENCYLTPVVESSGGGFLGGDRVEESKIEESEINDAISADFEVLDESDSGMNQDTHNQVFGTSFFTDSTLNQPYFKLSVITPLTDGSNTIPYLEYQIVANAEISDNKILYNAWGFATVKVGRAVREMRATQSIEENSIVNFVLQN